jgi:hypothetical protein
VHYIHYATPFPHLLPSHWHLGETGRVEHCHGRINCSLFSWHALNSMSWR